MAKPSSHSDWAVGNPSPSTNIIEPSAAKKIVAWTADERPPYEFFNWLFNNTDEWIKYFEQQSDAFAAEYDVIIGSGPEATHATLQNAVDDVLLGTNLRVLIKDDATINTTISLTKARWRLEFAPGVVYTKGTATTGLSFEAEGIVLNYGRFIGWTVASDKVIDQQIAAEYCSIRASRFGPSTDTEVDQNDVPVGRKGPISDTITEA